MTCSTSPTWDSLVVNYLSGTGDLTELYRAAKRPMERMVARIAPYLPEDIREEAVDEVFVRLMENPPKFTPGEFSARTLVFNLLRNAVRQVRALYAPPGEKTRLDPEVIRTKEIQPPETASEGRDLQGDQQADEPELDAGQMEPALHRTRVEELPTGRATSNSIEA